MTQALPQAAPHRPVRPLLATLVLTCLAATAQGQSLPRRVDCGDLNGFSTGEAGYELLSAASAPPGVSLDKPPLGTVHVAGNVPNFYGEFPLAPDVLCVDPDQLDATHRNTSLWLADPTVLSIDGLSPDTPYRVRLELGALAPWSELSDFYNPPYWDYLPSTSRDVRVEVLDAPGGWRTAASGIRCTSGHKGATFSTFVGGIVPVWVLADSDTTGRLSLRLSTDGSDPLYLAGFELHDYQKLPIVYRRTASGPLQGPGAVVKDFVTAFNAGDFDLAESLAYAIPWHFQQGVALVHLAGWLDGSQHGRLELLDDAAAALAKAALNGHAAAPWLVDEIASLKRALDHLAAGGRAAAFACPEDGGTGFLNTACAAQSLSIKGLTLTNANAHIALRELRGITAAVSGSTLLEDLADWNAGVLAQSDWEPSPLVFAALKLTGTTLVSMNPAMGNSPTDPDALAMAARRDTILSDFVDLGFAATDFPDDLELLLFREAVNQGKLPIGWDVADYQNLLSEAQIDASWWGDAVDMPDDDPAAPNWANLLRQQRFLLKAIADYWLGERLVDGDLGGGSGDDIELMVQLAKIFAGRQDQTDRRALDHLDDMVRHTLYFSGEVQDGYFAGQLSDVEHTAEYTTNAWLATQAAFGHTARAFDVGMGVAEHIRWTQDPTLAFAAPTTLGRLHFRSDYFTTAGPDTSGTWDDDLLLNGRAMLPAVAEAGRGLLPDWHPMVEDLGDWALAWIQDSFDTSNGKPSGWYGPVQWPSNLLGSTAGWWTHTANPADTSELAGGVHSYTLDLLRTAYVNSSDSNAWVGLLPQVRMFRSVMDWEDAGSPLLPPPGSALWAGKLFKANARFGPLVITHLPVLANDPLLTTLIDPLGSGGSYVDPALIQRMESWVEDEFNGQIGAMLYALEDVSPCGVGFTAKSSLTFTGSYAATVPYHRVLFPLLTSHVIHTDRVPLGGALSNLTVAATGENLVEGIAFQPLVRWRDRLDDGTDLAIQCNHRDYDAGLYSAFVYNFEPLPVTTTCQLDAGLVPGRYDVEWGAANGKCDLFPAGAPTTTITVQKRGLGMSTPITFAPGLSLLRITRQGPADQQPAGYDLAVDPPVVDRVLSGGTLSYVVNARVTNPSAVATPPAVLDLFVTAMSPDGALVGQTGEVLLASWTVPPLAPTSGWSVDSFEVSYPLTPTPAVPPKGAAPGTSSGTTGAAPVPSASPGSSTTPQLDQVLLALSQSGAGLQVRARVVADGLESDRLNNDLTRGWLPEQMALVDP